jgi:hypothetical protein
MALIMPSTNARPSSWSWSLVVQEKEKDENHEYRSESTSARGTEHQIQDSRLPNVVDGRDVFDDEC